MKRSKPIRRSPLKRGTKPIKRKGKPRFKAGRNEAFRGWVRRHPCAIDVDFLCMVSASECAHVRTRGSGGQDLGNCVPLCSKHHAEQHRIGIKSFEAKYGVNLVAIASSLAAQYTGNAA